MTEFRDGTSLGCIALCAGCGYAIQLRRVHRIVSGALADCDDWQHFRMPITPHTAEPKPEVGAYYDDLIAERRGDNQ